MGRVEIGENDCVVMAVAAEESEKLIPEISRPVGNSPIVNVHFRYRASKKWRDEIGFMGLIGGLGEWIFFRSETVSVTISAATDRVNVSAERIAETLWKEIAWILDLGKVSLPRYRVIKEKRATFLQTPANFRQRAETKTEWKNLFLAGDWTNTGLPATLEGTVRSGVNAATAVRCFLDQKN